MYEDSPNKEEIDWIAERVREIYDYDQLKDCDVDYLYNQEFGMKSDLKHFKMQFPEEGDSSPPSEFVELLDEERADREALTGAERMRLRMLEKEAEVEIRRAFGHRKEIHRKQRNKFANSISDAISSIASLFSRS